MVIDLNFDLKIDKSEILRYLGYSGQKLDENTSRLIDECIEKMKNHIKPLYVFRRFKTEFKDEGIKLSGTDLCLSGKDIRNHLEACEECVILCVTLGISADNLIRITQNTSMSEAVVLDACAVEFIEKICDSICENMARSLKTENLRLTSRFSPGYGDLPLEIQPKIASVVDAQRRIGLTVTESHILIPRKSVSAIIGIYRGERNEKKSESCEICNLRERCVYRKRGVKCND